jgi:AcrR family transcriptional regulator
LVHDASYVAQFDTWFTGYDHWYTKLFWVALVLTVAWELAFTAQLIAYGREEFAPLLSRAQWVAAVIGGVALAGGTWAVLKAYIVDDLYVWTFGVALIAYPIFGLFTMAKRRSVRGFTPLQPRRAHRHVPDLVHRGHRLVRAGVPHLAMARAGRAVDRQRGVHDLVRRALPRARGREPGSGDPRTGRHVLIGAWDSELVAQASPTRRRTQKERTAESTQRLITAAIELIAEKGFARTSAAEISERAGYSRSMVQFKYGTKEALLETLLRDEYETRLLIEISEEQTGLNRVLGQIDRLHDEAAANPELMRGFFALCFEAFGPLPSLNAWINDWLARYDEVTVSALEAGRADGSIRPDIEPRTEAAAFVASGLGYAFRWMVAAETIDYLALTRQWSHHVHAHLAAQRSLPAGP